jgi:hypothetical protein
VGDVNDLRDSAVITSVAGGADPTAPVAPPDTIARLRPQADEVVDLLRRAQRSEQERTTTASR